MAESKTKKLYNVFYEIISAAFITYSVVPGFQNIGHLFYQIFLTALLIIVFLSIADPKKIKPVTAARSLIFMNIYWVVCALIKQIKLHQKLGDNSFKWLHLFYYDKPTMLIVAYFAVFLFFAVMLLKKYDDFDFINQYRKFQKLALTSFTVYYLLIIFYCFYLVRANGDVASPVNLIPFKVFDVMKAGEYEYEFIFLFFGNIGIFLPLGILVPALTDKKPVIFALPFILSIGVEVSQYFLHNGQPDIDDVILNVIGYYLGYIVKVLFDKAITAYSGGKIKSIFLLRK